MLRIFTSIVAICLFFDCNAQQENYQILYHGTPFEFQNLEPHPSTRANLNGDIVWTGCEIFATHDFRIALFYTHNHLDGYTAGVDLISEIGKEKPVIYVLKGGNSLHEALDALYGNENDFTSVGYIYLLDSTYFRWEDGLGSMERISNDPKSSLGKIVINRRKLISHYLENQLINIEWTQ